MTNKHRDLVRCIILFIDLTLGNITKLWVKEDVDVHVYVNVHKWHLRCKASDISES